MQTMTHFLVRSARWWTVLLMFALNFVNFRLLFWLEEQFVALTGKPVFDTQNNLTKEGILAELPLYINEARTAYLNFAAYDFIFPLIAAFSLAFLWAWLLRNMTWRVGTIVLAWNIPSVPFLATLFDWGENIFLLSVVLTNGASGNGSISAALLFKRLKLTMLTVSGVVSIVLVGLSLTNKIMDTIRRARNVPTIS